MKKSLSNAEALKEEIRASYDPQTAEFLIRNLHKPLNPELLKTMYKMMSRAM